MCRELFDYRRLSIMPFYLDGVSDAIKRVNAIAKELRKDTAKAVRYEVEKIGTKADREHVPVDTGTLRASKYIDGPTIEGDSIEVTIGYGGAASAYAAAVHENPSQHDPPSWEGVAVQFHPRGRGRKFLQIPLNEAMSGMSDRIAERIKPK